MATAALGSRAVGSIVNIKVNGILRDFIVVHQGRPSTLYDSSCDGTWLLMKDVYEKHNWNDTIINDYANSTLHSYLNSTFLGLFDSSIRSQIKQVKIPYRKGAGIEGADCTGANGLSCKIFVLSGYEVGWTTKTSGIGTALPVDGAVLSYFSGTASTDAKRIAYLDGTAVEWHLRSPNSAGTSYIWNVYTNGNLFYTSYPINLFGIRPALILPASLSVTIPNTAPGIPGTITVPTTINGGTTITVSWAASTDAESNLEGYIVQRSTDGGSSWTQIYQGSSRSTTNSVTFGTASVMYRVKAYDSEGLESGWRTSSQVTVINNRAPNAPSSITVPDEAKGGASLTISWGAATDSDGNLSGYILERQAAGGSWTQLYKGSARTYTDTITKGWASVAYRVKAYDSYNAESGYTTSPTRTVDNNTAPEIACDSASGTDLGTKAEGFAVPYTVTDVDADKVTVTEALDGTTLRSFAASLGQETNLDLTGEAFMQVLNGRHTLTITASDPKVSTEHTLTFTKSVTAASVTLAEPMPADDAITICVLSVTGSIPADAAYTVEVTNNALDDAPVWEDCTMEVKNGANYLFENKTADRDFAFNFRLHAARGASGQGGYITSVQGGFQ